VPGEIGLRSGRKRPLKQVPLLKGSPKSAFMSKILENHFQIFPNAFHGETADTTRLDTARAFPGASIDKVLLLLA
jgi:hypothetical protein